LAENSLFSDRGQSKQALIRNVFHPDHGVTRITLFHPGTASRPLPVTPFTVLHRLQPCSALGRKSGIAIALMSGKYRISGVAMKMCLNSLLIVMAIGLNPAYGSDAFSDFGFRSSAASDLFRSRADNRSMFSKPTQFAYSDQWNSQQNATGTGCATSLGNNVSVQTQGSGNTVLVLNSQSNDGAIRADCSVGMN
jgi:hypothetical protein